MSTPLIDRVTVSLSPQTLLVRRVPGSLILNWSLRTVNKKKSNYYKFLICFFGVNANLKAKFKYSDVSYNVKRVLVDNIERNVIKLYCKRRCDVTCTVEFTPHELRLETVSFFDFIDSTKPAYWDTKLVVEKAEIKVHRMFLSMISPVFHAMFEHDSKESQTGVVEITDFTEEIVRYCIDVCFGKQLKNLTATQIIDMLKFFDKYEITCLITKLENWLKYKFTHENFSLIAAYAWQFSRKDLQAKCKQMFHDYFLALKPDILALGREVYMELVMAPPEPYLSQSC